MQALLQQAQKMQQNVQEAEREAEAFQAEGSAGGGAVTCVASGKYQLVSVKIKPEAVSSTDVEMLEEMICLAANAALSKVKQNFDDALKKATGGMSIPGLS